MDAARISAVQKVKSFTFLGFETDHIVFPGDVSNKEFLQTINRINEDNATAGAIVQFPPPPRLRPLIESLMPHKDVDALLGSRSDHLVPATADGIVRIVDPFTHGNPVVAVVGARGFIGQGIVHLLQSRGLDILPLDQGDDLMRVHDADIVVSVAGSPRILGPEHLLSTHRVVVDSGFVPREPGVFLGDVRVEAYDIPEMITPVPGGTGPVEMAVLMERMIRSVADPQLPTWRIDI
jgi:methylenetetrahydrofolate dehydrogenase (NADP+)/methenyltetrahydrofolate cyclohydrolase